MHTEQAGSKRGVIDAILRCVTTSTDAFEAKLKGIADQFGENVTLWALEISMLAFPAHEPNSRFMAQLLFEREQWSRAALVARWSAALGERSSNADMIAAAYLFRTRRYALARLHCQKARHAHPGDAGPNFLEGRVLIAEGRVAEGQSRLEQAARLDTRFRFAISVLRHALTVEDFRRVRGGAKN
tara:strand:- start:227 stop:781 length:555 start_codon:yes stop_codon:yes gene_type:complete